MDYGSYSETSGSSVVSQWVKRAAAVGRKASPTKGHRVHYTRGRNVVVHLKEVLRMDGDR